MSDHAGSRFASLAPSALSSVRIARPHLAVVRLVLEEFFSQVVSLWRDEGMQLCQESNRPHEVAADNREDEGRTP